MEIVVELLQDEREAEYDQFLRSMPDSLIYASTGYKRFLGTILPQAEAAYFLARRNGVVVGALPSFTVDGPRGSVTNSLPFYGSNGGVLVTPELSGPEQEEVALSLLHALDAHCAARKVAAITLVESPFPRRFSLKDLWPHDFEDQRIGQFTDLPATVESPSGDFEDNLMARFHAKTRNCVRKAQKSGLRSRIDNSDSAVGRLAELHHQSMLEHGGLGKPAAVFEALAKRLSPGRDFNVYMAHREEKVCAMLLVLYFNRVAEYFTPATLEGERLNQPMSLLIHDAMRDCVGRGCALWNWGGTWLTQDGVYQFKSRWGTTDRPYRYFIKLHDRSLLGCSKEELLQEYPFFFVVPFSELRGSCKE